MCVQGWNHETRKGVMRWEGGTDPKGVEKIVRDGKHARRKQKGNWGRTQPAGGGAGEEEVSG